MLQKYELSFYRQMLLLTAENCGSYFLHIT